LRTAPTGLSPAGRIRKFAVFAHESNGAADILPVSEERHSRAGFAVAWRDSADDHHPGGRF